jgi:protein FAM50
MELIVKVSAATPLTDSTSSPPKKKKKKQIPLARGKLSFGLDENDEDWSTAPSPATSTPANRTPSASPAPPSHGPTQPPRRLTPNPTLAAPPKALTKSNLAAETLTREILRKEFLALQESIKATEIAIPFVFYDGTNIPGGRVKVKKGDHIWLFLDRCRKVGAELGVSGSGSGTGTGDKNARREWARVSVDDLMLVRGDLILPHVYPVDFHLNTPMADSYDQHFEFYYFITNSILSTAGNPIFDFSNSAPREPPRALTKNPTEADLDALEGANDDPTITKVVDRRWYERNKHIYPATLWAEYEQGKDYSKEGRKRRDGEGNAFFFS